MEQGGILFHGLRCYVNAKAALVDYCMNSSQELKRKILTAVLDLKGGEEMISFSELQNGVKAMKVKWSLAQKEWVYDKIFGKRLPEMELASEALREFLGPVKYMEHQEFSVDILPFLVYGIFSKKKCQKAFMEYIGTRRGGYYQEFKESEYREAPFFGWFLAEERREARELAGFLISLRKKGREAEEYKSLIRILWEENGALHREIRHLKEAKSPVFNGFTVQETEGEPMEAFLSRIVTALLLLEEEGVKVGFDYYFYLSLQQMKLYEKRFLILPGRPEITLPGKQKYRKLQRSSIQPESCYLNLYGTEGPVVKYLEPLENLFASYGLGIAMLARISLNRQEAAELCSLFPDTEEKEYVCLLLTATLCKYIHCLEQRQEHALPEEFRYREGRVQEELRERDREAKELKQQICRLEKRQKELGQQAEEEKEQKEKWKNQAEAMQVQIQEEQEELTALRNFVYREQEVWEEPEAYREEQAYRQDKIFCKMAVIGGHANWQRKLKEYLPESQFVGGENKNLNLLVLKNKDYIVFNTDILNHSLYYKVMSQRKKEQKILYVHGNNVERTIRELRAQLEQRKENGA